MLKTIKTIKQMRLDELIKCVWDNDLDKVEAISRSGRFKVKFIDKKVILNESQLGNSPLGTTISLESTVWELEVEEPIKDVTLLKEVVYVHDNEALIKDYDTSIDEILSRHHKGSVSEIHALINGRLELVYEREDKNV